MRGGGVEKDRECRPRDNSQGNLRWSKQVVTAGDCKGRKEILRK
jgi:hypothetical protein